MNKVNTMRAIIKKGMLEYINLLLMQQTIALV